MRNYIFIALNILAVINIYANNPNPGEEPGILKGKLFDKKSKAPIEYATVAVYNSHDNSVVTGTVTNENGEFKITS